MCEIVLFNYRLEIVFGIFVEIQYLLLAPYIVLIIHSRRGRRHRNEAFYIWVSEMVSGNDMISIQVELASLTVLDAKTEVNRLADIYQAICKVDPITSRIYLEPSVTM